MTELMKAAGWFLTVVSLFMIGYGLAKDDPAPAVNQKSNLVCFDMSRNLRLNLVEYNIRFDHNIIRFTNGEGEYAIYPPDGWLCSIVKAKA